jgi:tetratricopeptide (TPR) repeat protein
MKGAIQMRFLCVLAMLAAGAAAAQSHHHYHSQLPCQPPAKDFPLLEGMGDLHHEVSTDDEEAQQFFNQGLTLIYAFNYDGAYQSFGQAFKLDDKLAMAQWGMALALGANINIDIDSERMQCAVEHIRKAKDLTRWASLKEADYIKALASRYSLETDRTKLAVDYSLAMRELYAKYWDNIRTQPDADPDAAVLYAESLMDLRPWHLYTRDGKPYQQTFHIISTLEAVIKRYPGHVGAVHYHLHALEPSRDWSKAAPDADVLRTLVPGAGHILHMPSHIDLRYALEGNHPERYESAATSNEKAITADRRYREQVGDDSYIGHYTSHNLHFLAVVRALQGRTDDALEAATALEELVEKHIRNEPGLEHYLTTTTLVRARAKRWDQLIDAHAPAADHRIARAMWLWGRAAGYAGKSDVANARRFQQMFRTAAADSDRTLSWGNNPSGSLLRIADLDLSARIAGDDTVYGVTIRKLAAEAEADLLYDEPPPWILISNGRYPKLL